jgi:peptidoglycan/xylan/chitin deacetylase (PgdA/CDA1 family)
MVALTFDDGPSKFTPRIIDVFNRYGGKATFCVLGNRVDSYKDIVKQAIDQHFEVIGHSWDHKQLTKLTVDEIGAELTATNDAIYAAGGVSPRLYRPPYGAVNDTLKAVSAANGLSLINWSVDTKDWKTKNADAIYSAVMSGVQDGSIVLCHDLYGSTAAAMERVVPELITRGYQLVTVSELLSFSGNSLEAGKVYNHR